RSHATIADRYLNGIPADSRAAAGKSLREGFLSEENLANIRGLNAIAERRGQSLAQMSIAWVLRDERVTTALVGASSPGQLTDTLGALENLEFSAEELAEIDEYARDGDINLWAPRSSDLYARRYCRWWCGIPLPHHQQHPQVASRLRRKAVMAESKSSSELKLRYTLANRR